MVSSKQFKAPTGEARRRALLRALLPCAALFLLQGQPVFAQSTASGGVPALQARVAALQAIAANQQQIINQLLAKTQPLAVVGNTVTLLPGYDLHLNGNLVELQPHQAFYGFSIGSTFVMWAGDYELGNPFPSPNNP